MLRFGPGNSSSRLDSPSSSPVGCVNLPNGRYSQVTSFPANETAASCCSVISTFFPLPPSKIFNTFVGAFNGNRFFNDSNRQVNYMARIRKIFDKDKLAVGASVQLGKQLLPTGVSG